MNPLLGLAYRMAGEGARALAAVAPADGGKLARSLAGRRGLAARLAAWAGAHRDPARPLLWMHAPSVGEGLQARPVLERLRLLPDGPQLAYTHFSASAERFARALPVDVADYLPLDLPREAGAALDALRPTALVFSKLDVWPVLCAEARRRGVRLGMVSATLASGSSRRSGIARALLRDAYASLELVGAIADDDAARLVDVGVRERAIRVTGDTRFDQVWAKAAATDREGGLVARLRSHRPTLVAGSTWPADEMPLLDAWRELGDAVPGRRLVIAPHEPTAAHLAPIERWAHRHQLRLARLDDADAGEADVVLVDRVGVLGELYALADVAFVGGGFHDAGLHSVLEPAAFGAPVLFGPKFANSREAGLLAGERGGASVPDQRALGELLRHWLVDPASRREAGGAARRFVERNLGAAERSTALVRELLGR